MKSITIRDLRQRWPEAERALETETELVVTRDGKPVAKLVRFSAEPRARSRFDPVKHLRWQSKAGQGQTVRWVEKYLSADRDAKPGDIDSSVTGH
ncbi:MAG: type II toxin-antitoxin system Phd/YefM family antitoxin [Chloroflexota bacterium]